MKKHFLTIAILLVGFVLGMTLREPIHNLGGTLVAAEFAVQEDVRGSSPRLDPATISIHINADVVDENGAFIRPFSKGITLEKLEDVFRSLGVSATKARSLVELIITL